ncbi:SAC1 [[Candida] subhashii]|uniref:SAC1 n=1 Tax=[Candida] subhashii TaxID=561895 RepID=A0A8J5QRP9_9ASCO|nr:SAC1 [[Candida] subhashii]KAG7664072.1 SAC1 [[Candida] subhashii]
MVLQHATTQRGGHVFYNDLTRQYLLIQSDGSLTISESIGSPYDSVINDYGRIISCLIGVIKLKFHTYVIIADKHEITGDIMGHEIAQVLSHKILPLGSHSTTNDIEELAYLKLLEQHLNNATLYFSVDHKYDLTNSLQRQFTVADLKIDDRFWWNKYLCESIMINGELNSFITPLIYGYFKSHSAIFGGGLNQTLDFALLTRRATKRAGTRYFRRGIDDEGNVANFNETEQFFTSNEGHIYSLLQTRGSVPVYWSEINNLQYKPHLAVSTQSSLDTTAAHFNEQVQLYGDNYLVNLVNQKGYELPVKQAYETAVDNLPESLKSHVNYIYFDFHHECKGMRYDRINLLLDRLIQLGYTSDNYFCYDLTQHKIISTQSKIIRTNCMDCLDRTNVVQSTIGRWVLQNQFIKTGYITKELLHQPFEKQDPKFNLFFQNFWADNADAVSCAYSGTGALKTDFTRLGKRTYRGNLSDLSNSITRYFKNNFRDGSRQDSYDLFLGKYRPFQEGVESPFIDRRPAYIQLLPYLVGTSFLALLAVVVYPSGSIFDIRNLVIITGCLLFGVRGLLYMIKDGYQFVDWPRLAQLDFLKKQQVYDSTGTKVVGIKYRISDKFETISKKKY